MKVSYDPRYNVGYILLKGADEEVQTIKLTDDLNVDIAPDGTVYGIELLDASQQLMADKLISFVNEATGQRLQLPIS